MSPLRQPCIYLPHGGGPCFFMDWDPAGMWDQMAAYLRSIPSLLPEKPKALVVISAHWEAADFTVLSKPNPSLYFDYYGFPPHTYALKWPAKNDFGLVDRVIELMGASGLRASQDDQRDYDHGVFIPLMLAWPEIDMPVIQISLKKGLDPAQHIALGQALAPLRDEGVLLVGSGMSSHNMKQLMGGLWQDQPRNPSHDFDDWLSDALEQPQTRLNALSQWAHAPGARLSHPREEHLIPLMVISGASGDDAVTRPYHQAILGRTPVALSAFHFGA